MPDIAAIIQSSATHAWLYLPFAVVVGALHALEPGHGHSHEPPVTTGNVSTGQIIWFGFTGGLMPCPAAIAVLLICVQLRAFTLGVAMVAAFSIGVGATLVAIGLAVVWSSGKLAKAWPGFDRAAARLPYLSAGLVLVIGVVMTAAGLNAAGVFGGRKS